MLLIPFLMISMNAIHLQVGEQRTQEIIGARMPAISPDGKTIAFQYRGDIWKVPAEGGRAVQVTNHVEYDTRPFWSPDGKWLAFSSDRNGNYDIFAIPSEGGETQQVTYSGHNEIGTDWSSDSQWIAFSGSRDRPWTGIFVINPKTLRFKLLADDYAGFSQPNFSPDGRTVVAQRYGFPWYRPRYQGSAAASLVLIDVATGKVTKLRENGFQHLWPVFAPDGRSVYVITVGEKTPSTANLGAPPVKYTDNANKTPNVWQIELNGRARRITEFIGAPVRNLSVSKDGTIVFEREGFIYTHKDGKSTRLNITLFSDPKTNKLERQVLTSGASEAVISPDEKTFAFVAGAEIWTVPLEKGEGRNKDDATRLTNYPGVDGDIEWSKDSKTLYFTSDRDNNIRLYSMDVATKAVTPIWTNNEDVISPTLSPDGAWLAFWAAGPEGGLYLWSTTGLRAPRMLFKQPGPQFFGNTAGEFSWSPDSRWIALTGRQAGGTRNVWIVNVQTGQAENVTKRNANHNALGWSADGKYLYFYSNRAGSGFFILPLKPENEAPSENKMKYEKPKDDLRIEIDFTKIDTRARRLFTQGVDGQVRTHVESGEIYFLQGGNLFRASYDGKTVRQLMGGVWSYRLSKDGKTAFALREGKLSKINLQGNITTSDVEFRAELIQNTDLVRAAAFRQFWRVYNRGFYDGNFHGRDWHELRRRYEPLIAGVGHRREFSDLLNMMIGEVEASHAEVGLSPGGVSGPSVSHVGFMFDYSYSGPGIKVGELFEQAPGAYEKTRINPGEYVMQINGVDVTLDEKLWDVLHYQSGRDFTFTVNTTPTKEGARTITYGAISGGEHSQLRYQQWVEMNRRHVEKATNGKVSYIHIRGMGGGDRTRFFEEFMEYKQGRQGMIIDVRFNGGGNISDSLIDVLERKPHGYYQTRDSWLDIAPNNEVWTGQTIVLMNEHSYSNGEMFPYAMRERGLATTIGMPTPGYVIWTWGSGLVDGTPIRMPMGAVYRMDGTPMENLGEVPQIIVPWPNEDYMSWKDPQLERAIQEIMKKIK